MTIDTGLSTRSGISLPRGSGMGGGIVPGVFDQAESMRPTIYGERWAIVGGHPLVSEVGADILRRGGNAIDAGVAAGFASNVVQVEMCNLGGIAPILVREAGASDVQAVAGVGTWGARADLNEIANAYDGALPLGGVPSIVPGAVSGWLTSLSRFGTMSLPEILAAPIDLARDGFLLDPRTASHLERMGAGFSRWDTSSAVYRPNGSPLRAGERLRQPALANTLQRLSDAAAAATAEGLDREAAIEAAHTLFYAGDIAETIAAFVTERGGYLDKEDLAGFRADVTPAPSVRFGTWDVHVTPTWSQGLVIAQALGILEKRGIRSIQDGSVDYAHEIIEALKLAFSERERAYGDPRFTAESADDLLADDHLASLAALIGERALPNMPTVSQAGPALPSTTAIVVVDADGAAFSTSPSDTIDGAPVIPELGIICSPRGVQSRLVEGHPNALRPGGRPCVTPAAVIALGSGDDVWAAACPGGDVIVQAIVQAMLQHDVYGKTPQAAVEAPRLFGSSYPGGFHPHPVGESLVFVEAGLGNDVAAGLEERGHEIIDWPANEFDAGSVQTIVTTTAPGGARLLAAGADSRRTAYAQAR
ncbi:gamma-glutamyltranspeptidase/glutathione hydrolase [Microbacteriaceae bacterium SG_E_30_P1]|uniref:Gamma-glutamyltranspeptidase/glutathione hydrolase n=1 Tax=Antiquaquibacter oligotrophicus TaxID=2880260 RepID=A0ABT6KM28_9MICO|nr:gamma-glutamyltransferase [Antiquaquibacter oligotrophicus]MDH6181071.1 gamma-glutamyltranspeptidase/glutathione hydrolase [Antiquaquibacter oligotrophicus]UDF13231.1 gamma-glutamyltransferase [Antiquaquibacter oligotrophicus]